MTMSGSKSNVVTKILPKDFQRSYSEFRLPGSEKMAQSFKVDTCDTRLVNPMLSSFSHAVSQLPPLTFSAWDLNARNVWAISCGSVVDTKQDSKILPCHMSRQLITKLRL